MNSSKVETIYYSVMYLHIQKKSAFIFCLNKHLDYEVNKEIIKGTLV